jgi:hypothetical protein
MSLPISSLTLIAKTSIGATHYLPLADGTAANYKLLIQDLFPAMNTLGASSESLFVSVTNKNTLNFKGIKSLDNLLTVTTASNNITLQVNPANIDLSLCDNSTSGFITGPVSLTSGISGTLPVANGGTGLATLTANSLYVGNGTSALTALGAATNGQIPIGRTGLSPVLATLTAGTNVTVTNGSGSITIAASLTTLTQNLNGAGYNIYGLGWLSGDGQNEGIAVNSAGKVFVGSSTPTAFYNYDLNVNNGIGLNGSISQNITMSSSATPGWLTVTGSQAIVTNVAGGNISIDGGTATGTGAGGGLFFQGGANISGSGSGGPAWLKGGNADAGPGGTALIAGGASTSGAGGTVSITAGAGVTVGGTVAITATGAVQGGPVNITAGSATTGTAGSVNITPGKSTSGADGKTVINVPVGSTTAPLVNFTGISGAASANSFSTSTASASAKTGAIKIQINGVDHWIRVYATAE